MLSIPHMVDDYNHHKNGIDISDQLRSYYYVQRSSRHLWLPLFFWLLDIVIINSFIIYKDSLPKSPQSKRQHKQFRLRLSAALLSEYKHVHKFTYINAKTKTRRKCIYCGSRTKYHCTICKKACCVLCDKK